jgi:hypothetical protein
VKLGRNMGIMGDDLKKKNLGGKMMIQAYHFENIRKC